jgi:hypothetical protein
MIKQNKELIEKYNSVLREYCGDIIKVSPGMSSKECNERILYSHIYGNTPKIFFEGMQRKTDKKVVFTDRSIKNVDFKENYIYLGFKKFSFTDTCYKMGIEAYPLRGEGIYLTDIGMIAICCNGKTVGDTKLLAITDVEIFAETEENALKLVDTFMECVVEVNIDTSTMTHYQWVKLGYSGGLCTEELEFKKFDINLKENYNDDLPYERIVKLINSEDKELILFDGKPGTGKTSLIKHLMGLSDKQFLYIDSNLLETMDSSKFISFLVDFRNSIVVLEDCEKILSNREEGNPFMGTLLNLTDGIIGETVKAKFICSFNCPEHKIDQALLRKGRLSLKYTFNELSFEKTKALMPEATKPLTLAEIYNKDTNNGGETKRRKIGF